MKTKSTKQVIKAIGNEHLELVHGEGYWYFVYNDVAKDLYDSKTVYTMRLRDLTLEQWVEDGRELVAKMEKQNVSTAPKFPLLNVDLTELKLADVVELFEGPFGTAVVTQITGDELILHRPYGVTGDFSYTGGVPYSVGNEVCKYLLASTPGHYKFKVWQRKELR